MNPSRAASPPFFPAAVIGAALTGAAALRLTGLGWGLPLPHAHIDESVVVFYALTTAAGGADASMFFDYPGLFLNLLAGVLRLVLAVTVPGGVSVLSSPGWKDALADVFPTLLLSGRVLSACFGVATVWLVYRLGRRLGGLFVGATAAALLAANRLHVLQSHYATVDVTAVFFSLLAIDLLADYWDTGATRVGLWAALAVGLAAAVKYYPAFLTAFLAPVPFRRAHPRPFLTLAALAATSLAGFLLGTPSILLHVPQFTARFAHLFPKIVGGAGAPFLLPTLVHVTRNAGVLACAAAAGGAWIAWRDREDRNGRRLTVLLAAALLFFGAWSTQAEHYALLVYPLLFLLAGKGLAALARWRREAPWIAAGLLLALAGFPTARQLAILRRPDTRLTALAWLRREIPPGTRLLRFAHTPEFTRRDPFRVEVDWVNSRLAPAAADPLDGHDYLLYASYAPEDDAALPGLRRRFQLVAEWRDPSPRFPHNPGVFLFRPLARTVQEGGPARAR